MYDIEWDGWTRTPTSLKILRDNKHKRRAFHFERILKSIELNKPWWFIKQNIKNWITNTNNI